MSEVIHAQGLSKQYRLGKREAYRTLHRVPSGADRP